MTIKAYMNDIGNIKTMSEDTMRDLILDYQKNPTVSKRNKIVEQNLKLVIKAAKSYKREGITFEDLLAEGNIGLIRGVEKYDPNKNVKIGYYLYKWINAKMLRLLVSDAHIVKMGTTADQRRLFFNLPKLKAKSAALGIKLSNEDIAEMLDVKLSSVQEMEKRLSSPTISLEITQSDSDDSANQLDKLLHKHTNASANCPDTLFVKCEKDLIIKQATEKFLAKLPDRERDIFIKRFYQDPKETFEVLRKRHNVSKQRVKQIADDLQFRFKKNLSHNQIRV